MCSRWNPAKKFFDSGFDLFFFAGRIFAGMCDSVGVRSVLALVHKIRDTEGVLSRVVWKAGKCLCAGGEYPLQSILLLSFYIYFTFLKLSINSKFEYRSSKP